MTTSPAEPYDFLLHAEEVHTVAGYHFPTILDHYFTHGYVIKAPTYFMLAGRDPQRADAWLVWWAEMHPVTKTGYMLRQLLRHMPHPLPFIGWARPLKGRIDVRYFSTERLLRFTQDTAGIP